MIEMVVITKTIDSYIIEHNNAKPCHAIIFRKSFLYLITQCVFRGCATCKTCRDPACRKGAKCKTNPTADSNDWVRQHRPKNRLERDQWLCRICSSGLRCAACDERNPENFSQSMQRHRWDSSRSMHCKACCHPACSFPECDTCKKCRDPTCRTGRRCKKELQELHYTARPQNRSDREQWLCETCREKCCSDCKTPMSRKMRKGRCQIPWICSSCTQKNMERRDHEQPVACAR